METNMNLNGFANNWIAACDAIGLSKCFAEYAENHAGSEILEDGIGFNPNSGYVYIVLEDLTCICSCMGNDIEYLHTDLETGEETFFNSFQGFREFLQTFYDNN